MIKSLGQNIDWKSLVHPFGWSPVHIAAFNGKVDMVEFLVNQGVNVNVPDNYDFKKMPFNSSGDRFFTREKVLIE